MPWPATQRSFKQGVIWGNLTGSGVRGATRTAGQYPERRHRRLAARVISGLVIPAAGDSCRPASLTAPGRDAVAWLPQMTYSKICYSSGVSDRRSVLREVMLETGTSQSELSRLSGVWQSSISQFAI